MRAPKTLAPINPCGEPLLNIHPDLAGITFNSQQTCEQFTDQYGPAQVDIILSFLGVQCIADLLRVFTES